MPGWARKGVGTSTPAQNLNWKGKRVSGRQSVQAARLRQQLLIVAFSADKSNWGVRVEVEDRPEAVDHPKKYAKYQWLGKPNDDMKALLKQQFENNPDWK